MQAKKAGSILICATVTVLLIILGAGNISNLNSLSTAPVPTGTSREGMSYGGQECIMYHDKLYWAQFVHDEPLPSTMKLVGTVTEVVDDIPAHNFESAVTEKGSEIYYTDNNPGCIIVKEGDVYYSFGIQDNSFPSDAKD